MLDINVVINKGIFFVRLSGILTKKTNKTLEENIIPIILSNGVRNMVINLDNINLIDDYGVSTLCDISDLVSLNSGKIILCNLTNNQVRNTLHKSIYIDNFYESKSELTAKEEIRI